LRTWNFKKNNRTIEQSHPLLKIQAATALSVDFKEESMLCMVAGMSGTLPALRLKEGNSPSGFGEVNSSSVEMVHNISTIEVLPLKAN